MATAQETLMGNPITAAFAEHANDNLDFAKMKYMEAERDKDAARQQGYAMAILGAKQSGEKDLEQMRNQAAMERTKESVRGYIDRLDEREKGKEMAKFKSLGIVPKPGEAADDFLARAATTHGKMIGDQANTIYGQIQANEQRANELLNGEQQRLASTSVARAKQQFAPSLAGSTGGLFGQDLSKLVPLLSSKPAESVIAQIKDPKLRANMLAQWGQTLEAEQQKSQKEVNPNVYNTARELRQQNEQLSKRHAELLSSNPNASPFVKFALPAAPKTFDDFARMEVTQSTPPPAPTPTGMDTMPSSFLGPLADKDVRKIVENKDLHGVDVSNLSGSSTDVVRGVSNALGAKIAAGQKALDTLGVSVSPQGQIMVPEAEQRVMPTAGMTSGPAFPMVQATVPLKMGERIRRHSEAEKIIKGMQDAKQARDTLQQRMDAFASPASAVTSDSAVDPQSIFQGPAWPSGQGE
jgi:hypothetical protein